MTVTALFLTVDLLINILWDFVAQNNIALSLLNFNKCSYSTYRAYRNFEN